METRISFEAESKEELYSLICSQLKALTEGIPHRIANLSNASALLMEALPDINWVGFYFLEDSILVLGPFQGRTACIEIPVGRGVCGTAVAENKAQLVGDVHMVPGHIACDSASRSEIVIPLHVNGKTVGVLDIDSPIVERFTQEDLDGLLTIVPILESILTVKE